MHHFLLLLLFLFIGGCSGGSSSGSSSSALDSPATTTFRVQLPAGNLQAVLEQTQRIDRVSITVSSGGQAVRSGEASVGVAQTSVDINFQALDPGQYTVRADGFSGARLLATASADATLASNGATTVRLILSFVESLTVSPPSITLAPGSIQQLTAGRGGNAVTATWQSSAPDIATVSSTGLVTAVAQGSATITASEGGESASSVVTVSSTVVLNSIAVSPINSSVAPSGSLQYTAIGTFSNNSSQNLTSTVDWSTGSTAIATISGTGLATGVAVGATTVTATLDTVSGSTGLTVTTTAPVLTGITVTPVNPSVTEGNPQQFTATGTFSDASMSNITNSVTWTSSDESIATVSSSGLAQDTAVGTTVVQASLGAISDSTTLTVTASGGSPTPGLIFSTTHPPTTDPDILPDVGLRGEDFVIVKANSSTSIFSDVYLERFSVDPAFQLATADGNGAIQFGETRGRNPSVAVSDAATNNLAITYEDANVGINRGFLLDFFANPTGPGTAVSTVVGAREPSVAINSQAGANFRAVTLSYDGDDDRLTNFVLGGPASSFTHVASAGSLSTGIATANVGLDASVSVWFNGAFPLPRTVQFQRFSGATPAAGVVTVPGTGDYESLAVSMFNNGSFVIVYDEIVSPASRVIRTATFDAAGTLLAAASLNPADNINLEPDVAVIEGTTPSFYVVWKSFNSGADNVGETRIQRLLFPNAAAHPLSLGALPLTAASPSTRPGVSREAPAVDVNANGDAVVVWSAGAGPGQETIRVFGIPIPADADLNF